MTASVSPRAVLPMRLARIHQTIGWAGWAGIALGLAALGIVLASRPNANADDVPAPTAEAAVAWHPTASAASAALTGDVAMSAPLAKLGDVPLLLTLLERAAVDNQLSWPAGDYRIVPSTDRLPPILEVRVAFKAPYPKLRAMVVQMLKTVPALTFREFDLSRATAQSQDVDAKLEIGILLDAASVPASATAAASAPVSASAEPR